MYIYSAFGPVDVAALVSGLEPLTTALELSLLELPLMKFVIQTMIHVFCITADWDRSIKS